MKKLLFMALLSLSFLFCGCFESTPKCDNKEALRELERLLKKDMVERYKALFGEIRDWNRAKQIAQEIGVEPGYPENDYKAYMDEEVKIEFSLFRTQQKDKKERYCRAEAKITFPDTPPSLKAAARFLKANAWGIQKQDYLFRDKETEAIVSGNTTRDDVDVWYRAEFTDDKKQVYVEWLSEGMEGF